MSAHKMTADGLNLRESESVAAVFVSLGSNICPEVNLPRAVQLLSDHPSLKVLKKSQVWESAPVGFTEQPAFCNAAVLIETTLPPQRLKVGVLRMIESELQRVRDPHNKNGPRTIDLDISLYASSIINEDELVIPDPEIATRAFLAIPLAELMKDFEHPVLRVTLGEIAKHFEGNNDLELRSDIHL